MLIRVQAREMLQESLSSSPSTRTCIARVVSHSQRVSVIIRVHGEEAHSEGAVLGIRGAVLKVLQVDAQLVVPLDGQGVDLLQACGGEKEQDPNNPLRASSIVLGKTI